MSQIRIESYDPLRHQNPMHNVDNAQLERYVKAPTLADYQVCIVNVCSFSFIFHSTEQISMCLDYYRREHHPTSRLPVQTGYYGGDQGETQRWFEKLPQYLLEKPKRSKVIKALEKALQQYSQLRSAKTGTQVQGLYDWA